MKVFFTVALAAILIAPAGADTFKASSDPVFQKMLKLNKGLASYKAHVDVTTRLRLASFTLHGTLYDRGDQSKVIFDNIPSIAKSTVEKQPSIGAPSTWGKKYAISVASQTSDTTTYRLVPNADEGVRSIDVTVQNATGLVQEYVWSNSNGMTITSDQTYGPVGNYQLVQKTTTKTRGTGIHADSNTTFTNYELNVTVPESTFAANP